MPRFVMVILFGAMGGSVLGFVWVAIANAIPGKANTTVALFGPAWVGVALSTGSALLVQLFCPEPAKKEPKAAGGADGNESVRPSVKREHKLIMAIILVAGSLDVFGDYGNRFARSTIFSNRYPAGRQAVINYVLIASNIISVFVGQASPPRLEPSSFRRRAIGPRSGACGGRYA